MQNGFAELELGLRDECLSETSSLRCRHARFVLDAWQHDYNHFRSHPKLGGKLPKKPANLSGGMPQTGRNHLNQIS